VVQAAGTLTWECKGILEREERHMAHFQVEHLSMHFGGLKAVDDVSFAIAEGAIHGLIGPNGAGKTTIFNCISGLYKPTQGTVTFAGHNLTQLRPYQIAALRIARTFQNIELFGHMTAVENLLVGQHPHLRSSVFANALKLARVRQEEQQARERAQEILRFLHLDGMAHYMAAALPFGHQKLLELGRALALEPRMLLLDEPGSGLNNQETVELREWIAKIRQDFGVTILLVEHDMGLVMKLCDRISVINFGVKIAEGTPHEIQHNPEVIEAYLGEETSVAED
jgi:branched-chain amino acid transport system ATP-binding protein